MDDHDLLVRYLIGAGILVACLLVAVIIAMVERRKRNWSRSIIVHVVQMLALFSAVAIARQYVHLAIEDYHVTWITPRMVDVVAVLVVAWVFMRQLSLLINRLEKNQVKKGSDPTSARMIARVMKFVVFVTILLFFGEHFGLSMSGLLAFGGIGGIAIGMAGKDILSNVFSGTMLYFDRQFNIGDWISSPDRNIEGTVVEIGWRLTKIMTFDHRPLYVPNSLFSSISVENPGRMTNRRIKVEIGLRYEDAGKIRIIVEDIRKMLMQDTNIDQTQTMLVNFNAFADSSLNIMVYCFTKTTKWAAWLDAQQDVYLKIIDIVQQHGADFAFPTQTLYMEKDS
ncbi:mechanosensitive ion channel family protein [Kerstersia sp.]|uniref:mechanosensitive ion channel family protein n=1 Tax=Kerstersia sp. TaxID=1930783 RepID=UPI003F91C37F